jgi:hypothetical protein
MDSGGISGSCGVDSLSDLLAAAEVFQVHEV